MSKLSCLILVAALAACNSKPTVAPGTGTKAVSPAPRSRAAVVTGKVAETMDAGGYTYVRLQTAGGDVWAAVPKADVAVGSTITLRDTMEMKAFTSKTLGRTFDSILFAQRGGAPSGAPAGTGGTAALPAGHPALPSSMPAGAAGAAGAAPTHPPVAPPATIADLKVPKATGPVGRTVAGLFADAAKLKDKPVVVHGVVVKFNGGIMNKNWVHLKDGTGTAAKKDDDITVTTQSTVKVGDKVKVSGIVRKDKDFGFGYKYATIVEEAKVEPLK